jgi:hypothetical protein
MGEERAANQPAAGKHGQEKKKRIILIGSVVLVIGLAIGLSMAFGVFYAGVKTPAQRVVVQTSICEKDTVVKKLNGSLTEIADTGDRTKAKEAIAYVKTQAKYDTDPTCIEALARFYYFSRDPENLSKQIDSLEKFAKNGAYPSSSFDGLTSLQSKNIDYENLTGEARK